MHIKKILNSYDAEIMNESGIDSLIFSFSLNSTGRTHGTVCRAR